MLFYQCVFFKDTFSILKFKNFYLKQVEELWDRVYQAWIAAHPQAPARGPVVTSEAVAITVDSLIDGIRKTPGQY